MITNINNKYVNIIFNVKEKSAQIIKVIKNKILRKELNKNLYTEINKVKKDLINFNNFIINIKYHDWITIEKKKLFLNKLVLIKIVFIISFN